MRVIFNFFTGRHTFFALFFAITAFILALLGKLDHSYVAVIVALQGYVLGHSVKEDHYAHDPEEAPKR